MASSSASSPLKVGQGAADKMKAHVDSHMKTKFAHIDEQKEKLVGNTWSTAMQMHGVTGVRCMQGDGGMQRGLQQRAVERRWRWQFRLVCTLA